LIKRVPSHKIQRFSSAILTFLDTLGYVHRDIYNINEKGFMQGVIRKQKSLFQEKRSSVGSPILRSVEK
jgi:hypothetical protein